MLFFRPIDAGVLRIGQYYDYNFVVPPNSTEYLVVGHCSSNCTKKWVPEEGVEIFNIMLHSHAYGKAQLPGNFLTLCTIGFCNF